MTHVLSSSLYAGNHFVVVYIIVSSIKHYQNVFITLKTIFNDFRNVKNAYQIVLMRKAASEKQYLQLYFFVNLIVFLVYKSNCLNKLACGHVPLLLCVVAHTHTHTSKFKGKKRTKRFSKMNKKKSQSLYNAKISSNRFENVCFKGRQLNGYYP